MIFRFFASSLLSRLNEEVQNSGKPSRVRFAARSFLTPGAPVAPARAFRLLHCYANTTEQPGRLGTGREGVSLVFARFPLFCPLRRGKRGGKIAESLARGSFRPDFSLLECPRQPPRSRTTRCLATPSPLGTPAPHKSTQSVFRDFPLFASSSAFYPPSLVGSGKSSKIAEILKMKNIAPVQFFILIVSRPSPIFS